MIIVCFFLFQNGPVPFSKFEFFVAWLLREVLALWTTVKSVRTSEIQWRHKRYKLHWGGTITEIL